MIDFDRELDACGLNCPLPLLRLKKTLLEMESGEVVRVLATDPAAHLDFGVFSDQSGHQILGHFQDSGSHIFYIKKK
ncbi:MAG: sulfurtransferase TusA family protein [Pseudomonadota bacterium]